MSYPVKRADHRVSRGFTKLHTAVDIAPLIKGQVEPCYAVGNGVVVGVGLGSWRAGRNVMIKLDGDGSLWWYGHLSRIDVRKGDRVIDGQTQIGMTGNTGFSFGVHLHLERHYPVMDRDTDPWPYIKDEPDPLTKPEPVKATKPAPAKPSAYGRIRPGAPVKLATAWRRYKYSNLTGAMTPSTLRAGNYRILKVDNGSALLQSTMPGYTAQGWVHGVKLEQGGGVVG